MKIAHMSDVHTLHRAYRPRLALGVRFLSFGRAVDPAPRIENLRASLAAAKRAGAGHVVISGDLTETGALDQFETFAETLDESGIHPDAFTLVPGNHDNYDSPNGWRDALRGPLARYRRCAAEEPGKVVDLGGLVILPVDVACHQPYSRSAGELDDPTATALERRLADRALADRSVLLVLHHSPFPHSTRAWQWLDGLRGHERLTSMLERHANVQVMHGHLHTEVVRRVGVGPYRVFGTTAVVDDEPGQPRVTIHATSAHAHARPVAARELHELAA